MFTRNYDNFSIEPIILEAWGGYTNEKGEMSLIVFETLRYNMIINEIKRIDNKVFYNVLDGYELQN